MPLWTPVCPPERTQKVPKFGRKISYFHSFVHDHNQTAPQRPQEFSFNYFCCCCFQLTVRLNSRPSETAMSLQTSAVFLSIALWVMTRWLRVFALNEKRGLKLWMKPGRRRTATAPRNATFCHSAMDGGKAPAVSSFSSGFLLRGGIDSQEQEELGELWNLLHSHSKGE